MGKVGNFHYHLDLEFFIFYLTLWSLIFLMVKMKMGNFCHSWTSANGHVPLHHGHNFGLVNSTLFCERFKPRSHFKSRLSLIIQVNVVLNSAVFVDSVWRFDNLCGSHLQSLKCQSLSTKQSYSGLRSHGRSNSTYFWVHYSLNHAIISWWCIRLPLQSGNSH